ncbi:MAG: Rieske (2Fe-2S) protein [Cycloclasticus sp.]|nr:MAG: Rieske (2Fe-2S) protein [Cycloclasticus sp.]
MQESVLTKQTRSIDTLDWSDVTKVPFQVYTDEEIYKLEQELIFRGNTWSFVALESELLEWFSYKTTFVGDVPVVVTRDDKEQFHAWVNRCSHRGAEVCRKRHGKSEDGTFTCVYHQWSFDASGECLSVPFRRGHNGKGGFPKDFKPSDRPLQQLKVETLGGLIFASFSDDGPSLEKYLDPEMKKMMGRVLCKPLVYLGVTRQYISANWKLYTENTKDPYHASLLHLFHATFGVYRSTMGGGTQPGGPLGMHSLLSAYTIENEDKTEYEKGDLRTYDTDIKLMDTSVLRVTPELEPVFTNHIQSIFPSMVLQQIHNTLAVRQILPKGVNQFELIFHFFGYEDDTPELRSERIRQMNLVGPAGYISMEDGEATELVQNAIKGDSNHHSLMAMGEDGDEGTLLTEAVLRSYWKGYRDIMGVSKAS